MIFHNITTDVTGRRLSTHQHDTEQLETGAALFAKMLRQHTARFNEPIPVADLGHIRLDFFTEQPAAAVATFYANDELVSTSVLVSGIDERADGQVLLELAMMIFHAMHDTGIEPGFDADAFSERPAIITIHWANREVDLNDATLIAEMETCLASAFFQPGD